MNGSLVVGAGRMIDVSCIEYVGMDVLAVGLPFASFAGQLLLQLAMENKHQWLRLDELFNVWLCTYVHM